MFRVFQLCLLQNGVKLTNAPPRKGRECAQPIYSSASSYVIRPDQGPVWTSLQRECVGRRRGLLKPYTCTRSCASSRRAHRAHYSGQKSTRAAHVQDCHLYSALVLGCTHGQEDLRGLSTRVGAAIVRSWHRAWRGEGGGGDGDGGAGGGGDSSITCLSMAQISLLGVLFSPCTASLAHNFVTVVTRGTFLNNQGKNGVFLGYFSRNVFLAHGSNGVSCPGNRAFPSAFR